MIIKEHALEEYWLNRRIELLHHLDNIAHEALYDDSFSMNDDSPKIVSLKKQYADVVNPVDVENTLKSIYPEHLYAPKVSK